MTAGQRGRTEQLVLDLSAVWIDRNAAARAKQVLGDPDWYVAALGVVDGWAVIYLLLLLREVDPDVAERASHFLQYEAADRNPAQLISDWQYELTVGGEPELPLAPHPELRQPGALRPSCPCWLCAGGDHDAPDT